MSDVLCIGCKAVIQAPTRPVYRVKTTGKQICPLPRCASCRTQYEAVRIGDGKGLELVESQSQ